MPVVTPVSNPLNSAYTQVGGSDPNGEQFGALPTPIGFFGATPVPQPPSQGANTGIPGTVTEYSVTVTATSVAPNTTAEQPFTVTGVANGQIVGGNKPTLNAEI